ncbi:hypothetical protein D5047_04595 [Verminephrobacter eiseniae]|nr:hypothetical protein [Verminephrobacter eiseniae]
MSTAGGQRNWRKAINGPHQMGVTSEGIESAKTPRTLVARSLPPGLSKAAGKSISRCVPSP